MKNSNRASSAAESQKVCGEAVVSHDRVSWCVCLEVLHSQADIQPNFYREFKDYCSDSMQLDMHLLPILLLIFCPFYCTFQQIKLNALKIYSCDSDSDQHHA